MTIKKIPLTRRCVGELYIYEGTPHWTAKEGKEQIIRYQREMNRLPRRGRNWMILFSTCRRNAEGGHISRIEGDWTHEYETWRRSSYGAVELALWTLWGLRSSWMSRSWPCGDCVVCVAVKLPCGAQLWSLPCVVPTNCLWRPRFHSLFILLSLTKIIIWADHLSCQTEVAILSDPNSSENISFIPPVVRNVFTL